MRFDFVVLGATGLQGKIASKDLLERGFSVLMCGRDESRVQHLLKKYRKTKFSYIDVRDKNTAADIVKKSGAKVVVNCVEGDWNLDILEICIKAGASCIDLGSEIWMTKKQFALAPALKKKNLVHITGCGSVPGVGNVMLRYAAEKFDAIKTIEVGFAWNSNIEKFVVPFSIQSIIEEFTDPATNIEHGKFNKINPMDSVKESKDSIVGKQERFYARHPETYTFYHYYKKKGVQNVRFYAEFPPHSFNKISSFIKLGFGSHEGIDVDGKPILPINFLTELLKRLEIPPNYTEKEDLWVTLEGKSGGKKKLIRMQCVVKTIDGWEDAGCNIDTGISASIMAQLIHRGSINKPGSYSPEAIVPPQEFFKELRKREMVVYENGRVINE
ncbi:saccharopine dehydrogenase NADP-binding domain-containing protein [Candidatus Pacearchaeota archaeon]|nr:saccharopine dehydrogenase NADP-binding domain-containing protein [Candidatus Pacearchaeota archaeon]